MLKDFLNAYKEFWVKASDFKGFTPRIDWLRVQFANLIIFAHTIPDFFTGKKKSDGENDFFNDEEGFHLTICEALGEMLVRPELKRNVWNSLQPLRKRIMSS